MIATPFQRRRTASEWPHVKSFPTRFSGIRRDGSGGGSQAGHAVPAKLQAPPDFNEPLAVRRHLQCLRGEVGRTGAVDRLRVRRDSRSPAGAGHRRKWTGILHTHHHRDQCQGDEKAVARRIPIAVPAHEQHLFADAENFWRNRRVFHLYYVRNDFNTVTENIPVRGAAGRLLDLPWRDEARLLRAADAGPHARLHHAAGDDRRQARWRSPAT